ncbi:MULTISPECIES: tripartite tricarboxylate transporter TctB family protein [Marinovum]|uniref:tripartite tricarboxylate transporter TctB family protein n=1 Tax=Marinovum TaxID=367771 RepID=UPI00237A2501|nr:tripartite tricarboxylate transporter TctB family protein [Marinovum sp. PR37]MDD9744518.1 tripartite tricarboxylate transporter TctB family protein [Marinovum sp. PR37]
MRLPDIWTGFGFACLGGFVALRATTFPEPAGAASPRLFPYMIGSAFVLLGLAVVARSLRARRHDDGRLFRPVAEDWMRSPRRMVRVLLIPLTIVAFGLLSPAFGTLLVATPLIFLNALAWQEKPVPALVSAVVICVVVTVFFTRVMRVPLPTGPFFGPWF